jgi:hypothetical protein
VRQFLSEVHRETLWPGERTLWTRFYLNAAAGTLETYATSPAEMSSPRAGNKMLFESAPFEEDSLSRDPSRRSSPCRQAGRSWTCSSRWRSWAGPRVPPRQSEKNQPGGASSPEAGFGEPPPPDPRRSERYFPLHVFSQMEPLTPGIPWR